MLHTEWTSRGKLGVKGYELGYSKRPIGRDNWVESQEGQSKECLGPKYLVILVFFSFSQLSLWKFSLDRSLIGARNLLKQNPPRGILIAAVQAFLD